MIHGAYPARVIRREVNRRARNDDELRAIYPRYRAQRANARALEGHACTIGGRVYVWLPIGFVRLEELEA